MRLIACGHLMALMLSLVRAAVDPAPPAPAPSPIKLPVFPVVPTPMPPLPPAPVDPETVNKIGPGELFVIDSKVQCVVRAHPSIVVRVHEKKGPRDITAKFAGGTGAVEDRSFEGPYLYVVTARSTGRVVLDVIPYGFKDAKEIVSVTLDVDDGTKPIPPPKPVDPVDPPKPVDPPAPIPGDGFRVLIVYETGDITKMPASQQAILYSVPVREYLRSVCAKGPDGKTAEFRFFDQNEDTKDESATWQAAMKVKREGLPWIVVSNGKTGYSGPLPMNVDDTLALLKKYAEGK